jgi:hypothetical protein
MKTMQKNRIVLGITAIVVIALLYVGAGYAFSGDARTYNPGDEQKLEYMSITPADFNPMFTNASGGTIFNTYVYNDSGEKIAYAFKAASTPITVGTTNYVALQLGTKVMSIENQTGAGITALNFDIYASGNAGNESFVYIFSVKIGEAAEAYTVFNGSATSAQISSYAATIADGATADVTVTAFVAYVPNVFVPASYIGPATSIETTGSYKYIQTATEPVDLTTTSFGIKVTDATA